MTQSDHLYFAARAVTCRGQAERAATPAIAAIHTNLATRYDRLATGPDRGIVGTTGDQAL